ncbi:MAG TPA: translation initiation factor IF-1 [Candidatus Paceibacterota bacterium]
MEDSKNNKEVTGMIMEALPDTLFRVELEDKSLILAYLGGKMKINHIRIIVGDKVKLVLDPYGGKGRITRRL